MFIIDDHHGTEKRGALLMNFAVNNKYQTIEINIKICKNTEHVFVKMCTVLTDITLDCTKRELSSKINKVVSRILAYIRIEINTNLSFPSVGVIDKIWQWDTWCQLQPKIGNCSDVLATYVLKIC